MKTEGGGGNRREKTAILFVDEEQKALDGIRRMLGSRRNRWEMAFARSAEEALRLMEGRRFDAVVTGLGLPGMDGAELLETVMGRYPGTMRFVHSGRAEREEVLRCVGTTHQYLPKPCEAEYMAGAIDRAMAVRGMLEQEDLKRLVAQIRTVPSLPEHYARVVAELESPEASIQRIGEIVSGDLGMGAKVLHLVNAAFFGLRRRVGDPSQAVSLLGVDVLKSVVLLAHVFSQMEEAAVPGWSMETLWGHSMEVAHGAQAIARQEKAERPMPDEAFTAGLFHDVGKLVLVANLPAKYAEAQGEVLREGVEMAEAERRVFGATHAEVGAYLLGLWAFPPQVVEAVAFHHRPGECAVAEFGPLAAVHVANEAANRPGGKGRVAVDEAYLERIGCLGRLGEWTAPCGREGRPGA